MGQRAIQQRKKRIARIFWLVSVLALGALFVVLGKGMLQQSNAPTPARALQQGDRPRAPQLPTWALDGNDADVPTWPRGTSMGGPVIVNFWASWCGPCRTETPLLISLSKQYADKGVRFVGVNAQDLQGDANRFVAEFKVPYTNVRATLSDQRRWGVDTFPQTFVVGRDGSIAEFVDGPVDETHLRAAIEREIKA
jgi:cytochrome c biogenesis protein CcmG/thiol:disulfide interchange protein DsbE